MTEAPVRPTAAPRDRAHGRGRWLRVVLVAAAVLVLAVAALVAVLFLTRDEPDERPLDEAVEDFRRSEPSAAPSDGILRPAAGVYPATGSGTASLSFPPLSSEHGPQIPVTITHEDDACWLLRVDFNEAHWQTWRLCEGEADGQLVDGGGESYQRWDLGATTIENRSTFRCEPASVVFDLRARPGASSSGSCEGTGSAVDGTTTSTGTNTVVGDEELRIGGTPVEVRHVRIEQQLSGAQEGTNTLEWWFDRSNGLPVRFERTMVVSSSSPVGPIEYREDTSWQLESRSPQT